MRADSCISMRACGLSRSILLNRPLLSGDDFSDHRVKVMATSRRIPPGRWVTRYIFALVDLPGREDDASRKLPFLNATVYLRAALSRQGEFPLSRGGSAGRGAPGQLRELFLSLGCVLYYPRVDKVPILPSGITLIYRSKIVRLGRAVHSATNRARRNARTETVFIRALLIAYSMCSPVQRLCPIWTSY